MGRRHSRVRLALLTGLFTLALLPNFGVPAHASPRFSGDIVASEVVHARPTRTIGDLTRPSAYASGLDAGSTGGDTLLFTSPVVDAGQLFDRIGIHWIAAAGAEDSIYVEVRTSIDGDAWSDWTATPRDEDLYDTERGEWYAGPFRYPTSRYAQYRTWLTGGDPDALGQMALTFMDVSDLNAGPIAQLINDVAGALADATHSYADAAPVGASKILTRQDWGADENLMRWAPKYQRVQKAIIHHTVTDDGGTNVAATIRSMYYFHAVTRGWGDIGYNYLVDKFGNIWTGRAGGDHVIAGHAYGWNDGTIGVAAIGDYSVAQPTAALQGAIANIVSMKFAQFGIQPFGADTFTHQEQASDGSWVKVTSNPPNVQGHRDANYIVSAHGGQTACPGNGIYNLLSGLRSQMQFGVQNGYAQLPYLEPSVPKAGFPGAVVQVPVGVYNRGATLIPAGTGVSYLLLNKLGGVIAQGPTVALQVAVAPGSIGTATVPLTVPAVGSYTIRWDLMTNGQRWNVLYNTPTREVAFRAADWSADWVSDNVPISWTAGETRQINVTVTNDGGRPWTATGINPVRLGYKWVSNSTGNTFAGANKTPLGSDVQPGQTVTLTIPVTAPIYPTNYTMYLDLYKENEFAFADKGIAPDDTPTGVSVDFKAAYAVGTVPFTAGQTATVPVTITNTGKGVFPTTSSYPVNLGFHWYNSAGQPAVWDGTRTKLPADLQPGQSVTVNASVAAPSQGGLYGLRFDLVQEGVGWFSTKGVPPTNLSVNVQGPVVPAYGASYEPGVTTLAMSGDRSTVPITVKNTSNFTWTAAGANPVTLSYHWSTPSGATVIWDGLRTKLAADVAPGQTVQLQAALTFPSAPGSYTLRWDLVHEGLSWFSGKGVPTFNQAVAVQPYVEPFYGGSIVMDTVPTTLPYKVVTSVPLAIQNLSNFDWGADVNASYHWSDAAGNQILWDGLRTSLAGMKVNEVRTVNVQVLAPTTPATYILRIDVVREGVTWFSGRGMMLPNKTVNVIVPPLGASYANLPPQATGPANGTATVSVTVTNTGSQTWTPGAFSLSYHLYRSGVLYVWDGARTALPTSVAPGQSTSLNAVIRMPVAGTYTVRLDMVQEGVAWFGTPAGSLTLLSQ